MVLHRSPVVPLLGFLMVLSGVLLAEPGWTVADRADIAPVWAGPPVGFSVLTDGAAQYVAYYDGQRRLTVARRELGDGQWQSKALDSSVGWDSHNYVTMAVDRAGCVHVSGNMHGDPLVYFRSDKPGDILSLKRVPEMVGHRERRCTYPRFLKGPDDELVFMYRDGGSGRGARLYNVYDETARKWRRLVDRPLLDGRGEMNAYPVGPQTGPDGYYHMCWVWRDTPDCSTNHDVCYARSRDLVRWETAAGTRVDLPITIDTIATIVDPVPAGGGVINGNTRVGFDARKRPIVSYHKFDGEGDTQLYNARFENGQWRVYQTSDWDYRWSFQGGGSIRFEIRVSPVKARPDGTLSQHYSHERHGSGLWRLDEATLKPIGKLSETPPWPEELREPQSRYPGMQVRWRGDSGSSGRADTRYVLRWETLGRNRDRPRDEAPPPSTLSLYRLELK
jgi:hypothetical protein